MSTKNIKLQQILKIFALISLLSALVFGVAFLKVTKIKKNNHFSPSGPGSLFYSETAFHYRYAKIIAEGSEHPIRLIRADRSIQYPETIDVLKYYTVMMEFLYGFTYRIFDPNVPFHLFLIYFTAFFSSLSLVMVFLIARHLFRDNSLAFISALFYLSTPISFLRTVTSPFLREDFALVFLLLSVYLILILLDSEARPLLSLFTGLVIAFVLSSWHFSQFVYICMLPFFYWVAAAKGHTIKNFFISFCVIFIAGFFVPVLKTRIFPTSLFMCGLYAIIAAYFLPKRFKNPAKQMAFTLSLCILIIVARTVLGLYEPAYSHVFGLFYDKIRFLLQKPDNPLLLSFNTRQLWEGAFNSPTPLHVWTYGKLTFPLGMIGALLLFWSGKQKSGQNIFIPSLTVILFALSAMVKRIMVLSAPFASIALLGCLRRPDKKNHYYSGIIILSVFLFFNLRALDLSPGFLRFPPDSFRQLCAWINSNTDPDDVFVARISTGPMILLNTGRPQVMHSKFENLAIRERYKELIIALYSTNEKDLFDFCRKYKAQYFVYEWASFVFDDKDSNRYLGGKIPIVSEETNAARLHFCNPGLKYFYPLYRNHSFTVFRVGQTKQAAYPSLPYSPVYDEVFFTKEGTNFKDTQKTYDNLLLPYAEAVNSAVDFINSDDPDRVVSLLEPVVRHVPRGSNALLLLIRAYIDLGQHKKALSILDDYFTPMSSQDIAAEPLGAKILELKADALHYLGLDDKSFAVLNTCLGYSSHSSDVYKKLYLILRSKGAHEQAEEYLKLHYEKKQQENK